MTEWQEFERLVAKIEELLVPKGATVKSPDHITDLVTGSRREVDASIRIKVGSTDLLITVECRRRAEIQDDTWIEQLAMKREKIGAARTIAVSSVGFSQPAKKTAALKGIELRQFQDITDDEITKRWLSRVSLNSIMTEFTVETCGLADDKGAMIDPGDWSPDLIEKLASEGYDIPFLHTAIDNQPISLTQLVMDHGGFQDVPLDGMPVSKIIQITFLANTVLFETVSGPRFISTLELEVTFRRESKPMRPLSFLQYDGPNGPIMGVVEGEVDHKNIRVKTKIIGKLHRKGETEN
jgi:hypothetical protein